MEENGKLTAKQRMFVCEYLKDKNVTQAAERCGMSRATGTRMMQDEAVKQAIELKIKEAEDKALVTIEYVVNGLKEVLDRCLQREPVMHYDYDEKTLVQDEVVVMDKDGKPVKNPDGTTKTEGVWKFDSHGANKALELLGKYINMFKDKDMPAEITVNITDYAKRKKDKDEQG